MLSRVADAVFWMARYLERTDNVLRVLRTHYIASQDEILDFNWQILTDSLGSNTPEQITIPSYREALYHIVLNKQNDASLFTNIVRARENGRSIQDFITKELWQCLNDYYHKIRDPHTEQLLIHSDPVTAIDELMRESIVFYGTVDITMNRGEGYNFLNLGKYIERSLQSLNILQIKLRELNESNNESVQWKYLLYSLSGYEFHSKFYKNSLQTGDIIQQVMFDIQFPHSVAYSLSQAQRYFQRLEKISLPENFKELEFLIGKASNDLRYSAINLKDIDSVQLLITNTQNHISSISQKLATLYFGYSS